MTKTKGVALLSLFFYVGPAFNKSVPNCESPFSSTTRTIKTKYPSLFLAPRKQGWCLVGGGVEVECVCMCMKRSMVVPF